MLRPVPFMGGPNAHCDAAEADLGSSLRARLASGMASMASHKVKTKKLAVIVLLAALFVMSPSAALAPATEGEDRGEGEELPADDHA
jgi:hypothetical protein